MIDWARVSSELDSHGSAVIARLISASECDALAAFYTVDGRFRSRVIMANHGFGRGEYKSFSYPLPERRSSSVATPQASASRRRFCCNTAPVTITACIRISTASMCFHCS